ncbi:uncharacterized protein SCHCODRAFT_02745052 [Schizophyllum commune H4-8]|uniref:Uncharacterized protein n=1 Tax=Schizophyllum commune (strain H4-8 / FGSC 9210) TaxID=578458 RepID=D8PMB0_SCHCM|nr:uncharacterized protein SCHCODRAFT_02745052 [Schizophyllum commune H4-8]KAI5898901.1 hypothetical protein SCHCODRAFT_02745052 [Schizophyllum commune H4-8]
MDGDFLPARPQYVISAADTDKRVTDVAHYNEWMDYLAPRLQQFRNQRYACDNLALRDLLQLVHDLAVFSNEDRGDELPKELWEHYSHLQYGIVVRLTEFWRRYYLGMEKPIASKLWNYRLDDDTEETMAAWLWSANVDPKHLKARLVTDAVGERNWEFFRTALWHCVSKEGIRFPSPKFRKLSLWQYRFSLSNCLNPEDPGWDHISDPVTLGGAYAEHTKPEFLESANAARRLGYLEEAVNFFIRYADEHKWEPVKFSAVQAIGIFLEKLPFEFSYPEDKLPSQMRCR